MRINKRKGKRTLKVDSKTCGVKRKKKAKVNGSSTGHHSSIEVIDLSDSEETTTSSQQQILINKHEVNQKHSNQQHLKANSYEMTGSVFNQLFKMNGKTSCEEVDMQENPNQIFLSEDFDLSVSKSNSESSDIDLHEIDDWKSNSESSVQRENFDKFSGISKIVKARCSTCRVNFENIDDNYLRFLRSCMKCHSPLLFQCRKCAAYYRHFQSIWDHVKRSCKPMKVNPSIKESALKAPEQRSGNDSSYSEKTSTSEATPSAITLDSDGDNKNFVNCESTLPIRIESVESRYNDKDNAVKFTSAGKESSDLQPLANDINTEKIKANDCPTKKIKDKIIEHSVVPQNSDKEIAYYQCYKCDFKAMSMKPIRRHIVNVHSEKDVNKKCSKCSKYFKSLDSRKKHEKYCGMACYKCKFCQQTAEVLFNMRKHLLHKHLHLFKWYELDGIMMEITLKRRATKEMFKTVDENKVVDKKEQKSADIVVSSEIENDVDKKMEDISNINELLRIRCGTCKVTFEKVEEKIIIQCPNCESELFYRCRLCDKFFALFDEAWYHISYKCTSLKNKKINDTQSIPEKSKISALAVPNQRDTYMIIEEA